MKRREECLSRRFQDLTKFPYGFKRSGVFSIRQASLLEAKGDLWHALMADEVQDATEEDKIFIAAVRAGNTDLNEATTTWFKYLNHSRRLISVTDSACEIAVANAQIEQVSKISQVHQAANQQASYDVPILDDDVVEMEIAEIGNDKEFLEAC